MEIVTIPKEFAQLLHRVSSMAELRDEAGSLIGKFSRESSVAEEAKKHFDLAAMEALAKTKPPGKPLSEILEKLKSLERR